MADDTKLGPRLVVGLTGGIASGKSLVGAMFVKLGAPLIDTDVVAREVVAVGEPGLAAVTAEFGPGVLLPSGLGLKIDNAEVGRAGFVRCVPNGCVAEVIMDDTLIGKLRSGQTATYIIFQTPEEGIGFPMSLKGFSEGFDKLP